MEMSLTHVTASTVSKPLCFSNQSLLKTHFLHPTTTANNIRNNCKSDACNNTKTSIRTRRPICVKAAKSSPSIAQSLSTNWDVSNLSISNNTSAPWLPRFEELDTTNMLLRQRIIFLGSQVWFRYFSFQHLLSYFVLLILYLRMGFVYCCPWIGFRYMTDCFFRLNVGFFKWVLLVICFMDHFLFVRCIRNETVDIRVRL